MTEAEYEKLINSSFGSCLDFLLFVNGARAPSSKKKQGAIWDKKEFADAVGVSDRAVRDWLTDRKTPIDLRAIENALFDPEHQDDRRKLALRHVHKQARQKKGGDTGSTSPSETKNDDNIIIRGPLDALFEVAPPLSAAISVPRHAWSPETSPPAALLRPDQVHSVPFHEREAEISDIANWCADNSSVRLRLYTGPGGRGKTRLAIEASKRMLRENWIAGFVLTDDVKLLDAALQGLGNSKSCMLFAVVDYAETHTSTVAALVETLSRVGGIKSRIILLARSVGDWWHDLRSRRGKVGDLIAHPSTERIRLSPVVTSPEARGRSWQMAIETFGRALRIEPQDTATPELSADYFDEVLYVHSSALAHLGGEMATDRIGILDHMVARERRFWRERLESRAMDPRLIEPLYQAVTAITLLGGVSTRNRAAEIVSALPAMRGQPSLEVASLCEIMHELYPGEHWIEPLLPDLIGEHLIGLAATEHPVLLDIVARHAR